MKLKVVVLSSGFGNVPDDVAFVEPERVDEFSGWIGGRRWQMTEIDLPECTRTSIMPADHEVWGDNGERFFAEANYDEYSRVKSITVFAMKDFSFLWKRTYPWEG